MDELTLYHFTKHEHVASIRTEGLKLTPDYENMVRAPRLWLTGQDSLSVADKTVRKVIKAKTWLLEPHLYTRLTVRVPGRWVTRYVWWLEDHPECRPFNPKLRPLGPRLRPLIEPWFLCFQRIPPERIEQ
jgi:hypothetical protein